MCPIFIFYSTLPAGKWSVHGHCMRFGFSGPHSLQNRREFFAVFRRAESSARRARVTHDGSCAKKITPVRTPLFMLFQRSHMNAAIQLVIWCHVIMRCFSITKWRSRRRVLLMKLFEKPFVFSKIGKGKTKEMCRLLLKRKNALGVFPNGFGKSFI